MPKGKSYPKSSKSNSPKVPAKSGGKPAAVPSKTTPKGYK
jgi:hypothetical protein